ncbi:uncharacterized protein SPPG_04206 [Spizellomyces punctatus DAOM BR117]|uniref:Uncharacterized protein n=1 Tax=Spizellomyces punctatus (strain DAOM BR117) TaxID=645134 RepID=A0A0L0HI66_SPIPD|nr:uncharacterized protein SPPG_04206 [Spizellomyces punctatus DAOM BR117]KND01116.1 hypothetical protein SPPG_04206 [Spizellomyces punctatus DAOM BR117]|eukprot:XP_016609155.1 hypothetical protein SPPG_04206 [Spizellomyces punctatus DAOM BR117]
MVLSRALTPAVRATPLLGASVATRLAVSVRRYADSPSGHDDEHGHGPKKQPLHKEEWLKVARNWPNEYHYPGHYRAGTIDEVFPPTNNYGHTSELPTGSETLQHPETFFSGFWVKVFLAIAGTAGIYRLNEHYTAGKDVHPITEFLSKYENTFQLSKLKRTRPSGWLSRRVRRTIG